jgi:hypothetical protein
VVDVALISDYKIEDYQDVGYEKKWSIATGIYRELLKLRDVKKIIWYPFPPDISNFPFHQLERDIKDNKIDPSIIIYLSCGPRDDSMFSKYKFPNSKLVVDLGDEPLTKVFNSQRASNADIVLTPDRDCYNFYKSKGYNVIHTGHWADIDIFKPDPKTNIKYDVVTSMKGNRGKIPKYISTKLKESYINKNDLSGHENAILFQSGKIIFQKSRFNELTRRIFEGMATNKMVITDRLPESKRLDVFFEENKEIVLYDNKREALKKIKYYLKNDKEREEIAKNGYEKVKKYYTSKNIVNYII